MADSILNHSWPSFSKLWMKRWSFKRGSECKPCAQPYASSVPASASSSPRAISTTLNDEQGVFFSDMVEEKDDSSSMELEAHSSSEDLLSLDPILPGTEFYEDLGLLDPLESCTPPETELPSTPTCPHPKEVFKPSGENFHSLTSLKSLYCVVHYGEASCHFLSNNNVCSCVAGPQDPHARTACLDSPGEEGKGDDFFPILVRSMSTSRRHSWENPMSSTESKRRLSLDASDLGSDEERGLPRTSASCSLNLPRGSFRGCLEGDRNRLGNAEEVPETLPEASERDPKGLECGNAGKRLSSKSVPKACDKVFSPRISQNSEVSSPVAQDIESPVLEGVEKGHMTADHVNEDSGKIEKSEKGTKVKRRLSSLKNRVTGSWQKDKVRRC
uniref:Uncharacterized protein n=1 Tax=Ornithorhynchus anatinus TaxID=9258 RepID=A0A6I8P7P9_ORNAN